MKEHTFPKDCYMQVIIRTEETGKYDSIYQFFRGDGEKSNEYLLGRLQTDMVRKILEEGKLPF